MVYGMNGYVNVDLETVKQLHPRMLYSLDNIVLFFMTMKHIEWGVILDWTERENFAQWTQK